MYAGVWHLFWLFLHLLDDGTKPAAHGISRLICNFQHTGMAVLHGLDAGGHIGDAADRKHLSDLLTKWAKPLKQVGLFIGEDSHGLTITVDDTGHGMTEQQIAADTGLSKVTVRRYLNYLIGTSKAESQVDYSTGGRPRVEYRSR